MAAPGRLLGVRKLINSLCKLSVNPGATCRPSSTYSWRSHDCGALGAGDVGEGVRLAGWLQYRRLGFLLTLRDGTGVTQVTLPHKQLQEYVEALPTESVIEVKGTVQLRPEGQENKNMSTGEIEVIASDIKLLNACDSELPYQIRNAHKVKESLRLQYRYLDLRRPAMQRNLRLRSQILNDMRYFLCHKHGFVDVETPTLFRKTPGGAREFPVATHSPGQFYTLPQSPQQFKQLLMVGAIDRYMQVARCYRDETAKPNRQPEFTQLDLELSFTSQADVQLLVEELLRASWPVGEGEEEEGGQGVARLPEGPFPRLTYRQAMLRYGTDKPDTRFAMEIEDITEIVSHLPDKQLSVLLASGEDVKAKALTFHGAGNLYKKSSLKKVVQKLKEEYTLKNVYHGHILKTDEYQAWNIGEDTARSLQQRMEAGDVMIVAIGTETSALTLLGHVRLAMAAELERKGMQVRKENAMEFLWVEDFPMFLPKEDGTEGLESAHHPFTAPHPDDADLVYSHPEQARSQHYDLVLNGAEVGGGSIRIHDSKLQRHVLNNILKEDTSSLEHLLTALDYGCPPHGGIALGIDRLMSIICDTASIRDVIAFPKSGHGLDLMSKAPAPLTQQDLDYYHLPSQTDGEKDPTQEKL